MEIVGLWAGLSFEIHIAKDVLIQHAYPSLACLVSNLFGQ